MAITLMGMLPPAGWGDGATRQQLEALELRLDGKLELLESRLDTKIALGNRQLVQWTVGTMIAMTGIFATIVGILR